jgi:hypothetical protein
LQSKVELGDEKCYKIEGVGSISFRLESGARLHVDEVLYVLGLKKNLLSVATLEDKGYWVIFKDRKELLWAKGSHLSTNKTHWNSQWRTVRRVRTVSSGIGS